MTAAPSLRPAARARALADAWRRITGHALPVPAVTADLVAYGWTEETVHDIACLAEHAISEDTALVRSVRPLATRRKVPLAGEVCTHLRCLAAVTGRAGLPVEETVGWMSVLASAPGAEQVAELEGLHTEISGTVATGWLRNWRLAAGPAAPLAWAAGLTPAEAAARHLKFTRAPGRGLATLARLRGFVLPPVSSWRALDLAR